MIMKKIEKRILQIESQIKKNKDGNTLPSNFKKIGVEKLPYPYSSLSPFIDSETMKIHYNKHYKGYVDKLNNALSKKNKKSSELIDIIKNISRYDRIIRNNAGGAFNHALFWSFLSPNPTKLTGELRKKIDSRFGSLDSFKKEFETKGKTVFGSGWVWLVLTPKNTLKVMTTPNQDNPLMDIVKGGGFPLLGLDLWEHAYYLKYQNRRDEYISNFWKVVNWDFVSSLYEGKTKTNLLESNMKKSIIFEDENVNYVQACTPQEERFFQSLMKNSSISQIYGSGIYKALKNVSWLEYKPKDISQNRMQGFYENGVRHDLSYLAGNYRAFCLITKSVNNLLKKTGKPPIILSNKTPQEQEEGIQRLVKILVDNAEKIFNQQSPFYQSIISNLGKSKLKGEKIETLTKERLSNKFGETNVNISSGFGLQSDTSGFDGELTVNGKTFSMQIKPFTNTVINDEMMVVSTTGKIIKYNQDLMVFTNSTETRVFKNNRVVLGPNSYIFPVEDLIFVLK